MTPRYVADKSFESLTVPERSVDGTSVDPLGAAFLAGLGGAFHIMLGFYLVQRLDR